MILNTTKTLAAFTRWPVAPVILGMLAVTAGPLAAQTTEGFTTLLSGRAVRQTLAFSTGSVPWVNIPGATATFTVPANTRVLFLARYTAESVCSGVPGWCSVRILLNGVEMDPAAGSDFAFDSTDAGTANASSWESHSVERSRAYVTGIFPVTVTLQVQAMVTAGGITSRLDDWHFTAEEFR